jgi:hypothetical protein
VGLTPLLPWRSTLLRPVARPPAVTALWRAHRAGPDRTRRVRPAGPRRHERARLLVPSPHRTRARRLTTVNRRITGHDLVSLAAGTPRDFYLCGPGPMVADLTAAPHRAGADERAVHTESFTGNQTAATDVEVPDGGREVTPGKPASRPADYAAHGRGTSRTPTAPHSGHASGPVLDPRPARRRSLRCRDQASRAAIHAHTRWPHRKTPVHRHS